MTNPEIGNAPVQLATTSADVCETITFDQFAHGDDITSLSTSSFGTLSVAGTRYVNPSNLFGGAIAPKAFNTSNQAALEDDDLQAPPVGDCADCAGLNSIMVLPDERGFSFYGDYRYGGTMTIGGFSGGSFYVSSYKAVDDDGGEPSLGLYLDGASSPLVSSTGLGDATVETVNVPDASTHTFTSSITFRLGTPAQDAVTGSGGVDDIRICKVTPPPPPPSNPGTGTPGYWKNHASAWPSPTIVIGGTTYTVAQAIALMQAPTAGDKTYNMFEQLVSAKLNTAIGNDASCVSDAITAGDAFMAAHPVGSGVKASSAAWTAVSGSFTTLSDYNSGLLCAPHRD